MPTKNFDAQQALNPGEEKPEVTGDVNYQEFMESIPPEFQAEIEASLTALLSYVHSDEGTTAILEDIQNASGDEAAQIGRSALQAMDAADADHQWSDSAKVFAGYFAVREVANLAREAGLVDIPEEEQNAIYQEAAKNYIHALIKNKPTPEERDAEAIRIQKEIDPLLTDKMREAGNEVAMAEGFEPSPARGGQQAPPQQQAQGGLLE